MTDRFGTNVKRITLIKAMLVLALVAVGGFIVSSGGSAPVSAPVRQQAAGLAAPAGSSASAGQSAGIAPADENAEPHVYPNGVIAGKSYKNDVSPALRDIPPAPVTKSAPRRDANESPLSVSNHRDAPDKIVQKVMSPLIMPSPILNFDGIGYPGVGCNCAPPDTDGEVGATQYVQMVNEGFQVFNKATGASVLGPVGITTVWAGFTGVCETAGDGDPVVLYDQLANRWLISQFAGAGVPTDECIAISTTSDATGTWNRYGFHLGTNFFDYPHLGVWPDAYYMSDNVFNAAGTAFLGPQPFAFDRAAMLAGHAATFVSTGITGGSTEDAYLPADLDGSNLPPAGAPNSFVEWPGTGVYKIWHFHADFVTPANSTFTLFSSPAAAAFTVLCGGGTCVPQPGTTQTLDTLGDRLMFRAADRYLNGYESLVVNYTVSSGGVGAVRWVELRNVTSGPVTKAQESTYQPDTTWRWMGSIAQDVQGNMALGFSASSSAVFPSLRYAGRLATDPINTMAQGEATLFSGTGSQTGGLSRWGDYSDMTVDPVDDCTFWYTNEYLATNGSFNWRTRIGNFKFPGCTQGTPTPTVTGTPPTATRTNTPTHTATATNTPSPTATIDPCLLQNYQTTTGSAVIVPGTTDIGNHCDDCTTTVSLPFPYLLYGQTFNSLDLESNGKAHFVTAATNFTNACLPVAGYTYTIFPYWDDLYTLNAGYGIFTSVSGTAPNRIFNIEWRAQYYPGTGTANFELRLYEGQNRFDVIFGTLTSANTSASSGVQKDSTLFTQYFCNAVGGLATGSVTYSLPSCSTATATATRTNTVLPTNTFTNTPVPPTNTPTLTRTSTPSATRTNTPIVLGSLVGHVTWQGPAAQPSVSQQLPITLTLCVAGLPQNYNATTDASGFFTATGTLLPGNYNWWTKGPKYLANSGTLTISSGTNQVEMGLQRAGDLDPSHDNLDNASDFNTLKSVFGSLNSLGDLNNDGLTDAADFNLLKLNFGSAGALPNCP